MTTTDPASDGHFVFPARKQRLPDGRWVVSPGPPEMRVRTHDAVRITGIPSKTFHRLTDADLIRRAALTPNIVFWWPTEIEALIERMSTDDTFARSVRFRIGLGSSDIPSDR